MTLSSGDISSADNTFAFDFETPQVAICYTLSVNVRSIEGSQVREAVEISS